MKIFYKTMNNTPIMVEVEMSTKVHTFPGQFIGKINPLDHHIPKEIHNSKPVITGSP